MKRKMMRHFSLLLVVTLLVSSLFTAAPVKAEEPAATIALTQEEVDRLTGSTSTSRVSVHDPSIVKSGSEYYIFGSHMGYAKTTDLQNWTALSAVENDVNSTLFADADGNRVSFETAFGEAALWNTAYGETVSGNMWAPDVIYNPTMQKWCMYLSLNGSNWNSVIILLTSDKVDGPYVYQGPVVYSGFTSPDTNATLSYKNTDLEQVIGTTDTLPAKYEKPLSLDIAGNWGEYWPHAIDPAVMYDAQGKLWLTYGSWSGGIYMLELDESTGLRDYNVTYTSDYDSKGRSVTTDEYFGTKIAGGYYVSGEGAYIEKIGNYYYLFVSYGFYSPEGGYNMRVFRSENPNGPYVDGSGKSAIFDSYIMNFDSTNINNNRGEKIIANYKWDTMAKAEVAQGHNSAFVDSDGKAYVIYHTKFNDGTAAHEVRVHQLFVNEAGWLVAAPYEYSGETISDTGYAAEDVVGNYSLIIHDYQIDYASLAYKSPESITLNADGTITGDYEGTWATTNGTAYVTLTIGGVAYKGVFTEQVVDGSNITVMCFTAASDAGLCIWGSGEPGDDVVVAQNVTNNVTAIPTTTYADMSLPTEGLNGAVITWTSSNPAVLSNTGDMTLPETDTVVTLTARIAKGNYYFDKAYNVTVKATRQSNTDSLVLATYFTDAAEDLSQHIDASLSVPNPFYSGTTNGLDLSGGVTIEFDAVCTGDVHGLGTIFSFMGNKGDAGRFYFTPGSYLGYNATGGYFDANMVNWACITDYIGDSAHVAINVTDSGFTMTVDGEVAYTQEILSTAGGGTLTDYSKVLEWLSTTADTLYFGYGSWWNTVGADEANISLSNVVCSVGPVAGETIYDDVSYTKDEVVLATNDALTIESNPFYGKKISNLYVEYTINMTSGTAQNGWDGIFAFFNAATNGRVSFQTAPYVCYNDWLGNWLDINQPGAGGDDLAPSMTPGTEHTVGISITLDEIVMTVDGNVINIAEGGSGTADATYENLLKLITQCDELCWGVGLAVKSGWNTELCTLTDISFTSEGGIYVAPEAPVVNTNPVIEKDSFTLDANNDIEYIDNPFYKAEFDAVSVEYTVNFSENAIKTGWDGLFAFYNSTDKGRVSFQSAPYICYNGGGNWMDIDQPINIEGGTICPISNYSVVSGVDYDVNITITEDEIKMYLNGMEVDLNAENGSGATYANLLAYIKTCDKFTFGVGEANNGGVTFWNTELCTIKNLSITSHLPVTEVFVKDTFTNATAGDIIEVDNPYYNQNLDKLHISYSFTWNEGAAKNGFDGLFGFYNSTTSGKVGFLSSAGIAFNDWAGNWMDFNKPGTGGVNAATDLGIAVGDNVDVTFDITAEDIVVTVNGNAITTGEESSGATYADILDYISKCDKLTYGVGLGVSSPWNTELATVNNLTFEPCVITVETVEDGTATAVRNGNTVTLTATPDEKGAFLGWYIGELLIGTETTMDIVICKDVSVMAKFAAVVDDPSDDNPSDDNPSDDNPSDDNPSDDNPSDNNPSDDNPSDDTPSDDNSNEDEQVTEEPTTEAPTTQYVPIVDTVRPTTEITINQQLDADALGNALGNIANGEALKVKVNRSEVSVALEIFAKAADKGIELIFDCGNYAWKFVDLVAAEAVELKSLNVDINANVPMVEQVLSGANVSADIRRTVSFAHDGELPGRAEVTINVSGKFGNGKELYFYYFNEVSRGFELISKVTVADDKVVVGLTHCSDYVITEYELPAEIVIKTATGTEIEQSVETGDNSPIALYIVLAIVAAASLAGFAIFDKKRKYNN